MKRSLVLALALIMSVFFMHDTASAAGLRVAPLEYRSSLNKGEVKKGHIDVSNPSDNELTVKTSVQAFRQVDDNGTLQFYDNEQVAAGVLLDLDEFKLGPKEAIRMYFLIDGRKLPSGDVFGAIFFTTTPTDASGGVGQAVKLGTLLSLVNGTPGSRDAAITRMEVPLLQFDGAITGTYTVKNTANPKVSTGFYPQVRLASLPLGETREVSSKLVFAGRERENGFSLKTPPIGVYQITASYGQSTTSRWVVVLSPVAIAILAVGLVVLAAARHLFRRVKASQSGSAGLKIKK